MPAILPALLFCAAALTTFADAPPEAPASVSVAPAGDPASPEALGRTPEQHATARRYARQGWTLWFVQALGGMAILAVLTLTGTAGRIEGRLAPWLPPGWRRDAAVAVTVLALLHVLQFPLDVVRHQREVSYGFATQTFGAWLLDRFKMAGVETALALVAVVPLFAAMRRLPRWWWAAGAAGGVVLTIFVAAVMPVFIAPLFNTFQPLPQGPLRSRIEAMARAHGIPDAGIFQVDASRQSLHDNAYVAGLLGTERIVLYDTLIDAYTPEQVLFVLGHEIGHDRLAHIWKGIGTASAALIGGFWLLWRLLPWMTRAAGARARIEASPSAALLPLVMLYASVCGFVLQPVAGGVSRHLEHQADLYALRAVAGEPGWRDTAVSSFQKMAARNLSDPDPPAWIEWFLYSHPSAGRRIRFCAAWQPG